MPSYIIGPDLTIKPEHLDQDSDIPKLSRETQRWLSEFDKLRRVSVSEDIPKLILPPIPVCFSLTATNTYMRLSGSLNIDFLEAKGLFGEQDSALSVFGFSISNTFSVQFVQLRTVLAGQGSVNDRLKMTHF
jgi:hypothetical protein